MEGWTMILVRSEHGEDYLNRAVEAGILELREAEEEQGALEVMNRLATKQRLRVKPDDPHAEHSYATQQALDAARAEVAEES